MPSNNRKFIRCAPIEGAWSFMADIVSRMPGYEALALLYRESYHVPDGVLVRTPSGILGHYSGGALRSIDQRKASAGLERMEAFKRRRNDAVKDEQYDETD